MAKMAEEPETTMIAPQADPAVAPIVEEPEGKGTEPVDIAFVGDPLSIGFKHFPTRVATKPKQGWRCNSDGSEFSWQGADVEGVAPSLKCEVKFICKGLASVVLDNAVLHCLMILFHRSMDSSTKWATASDSAG